MAEQEGFLVYHFSAIHTIADHEPVIQEIKDFLSTKALADKIEIKSKDAMLMIKYDKDVLTKEIIGELSTHMKQFFTQRNLNVLMLEALYGDMAFFWDSEEIDLQ